MPKCKDNIIIAIGRTFGSGGREIGRKIADELGIPFYDKELLLVEARESSISQEHLAQFDENRPDGLIFSMAFNPFSTSEGQESLDMVAQKIQVNTIKHIAEQGSCVIVGRRADQILRDEYDVLSVFVSASLEKRVIRVSKRDGLSEKDSKKRILKADKSRRSYYDFYGEGSWGEAANYNLCLDSSDLGIDNSAAMILQYLKLKEKVIEG